MVRAGDIFELRLFDRALVSFSFGEFDPVVIHDWDNEAESLLPLGMKPTDEGLWRWLSTRAIPQNRRFAGEICRSLGLSANDRSGILRVSRGLSLNDSYWIVSQGFDGKFADFNLFENGFSAVLAAVAYTGVASDLGGLTPSTPELTTNGSLRKAWRIADDGTRLLYKGSSVSAAHVGEARAEFLASQVALSMGLNVVGYDLGSWSVDDAKPCSICACFCSPEVSFVPQALAIGASTHGAAVRAYLRWSQEQFERYVSMMVFDSLICNTDRHLTNFGILRDSRTGSLLGMAPIFDSGRSLFFNLAFDQTDGFAREAELSAPSWAQVTFTEQAARLMGDVQKAQLERLCGFEFRNSEETPFPETYLNALSSFIRQRAEELASLPPVSRDALRGML